MYSFNWDGQKGISWRQMFKSKPVHGGIGLWDIQTMVIVNTIKRTIQIWTFDQSIWIEWIRMRYVKGRYVLGGIERSTLNPPLWNDILKNQSAINTYVDCKSYYTIEWKGKGLVLSAQYVYNTIQLPSVEDPLAREWNCCSSKMLVTLWLLRWNKLYIFDKLHE